MSLSFLPDDILLALGHLNENLLTEVRIRNGSPIIIGYDGGYYYLGNFGKTYERDRALVGGDIATIINAATGGSIYSFAEQIKSGFITYGHGVRIGLAGEYVMQGNEVKTICNITSVNVRIPHDVKGCAGYICKTLLNNAACSMLIFSKPGLGKTTKLRDIARHLSDKLKLNVVIFDERNEISAMDSHGSGYILGDRVDVMRAGNKITAFESAIRAMKPDVVITDELYGDEDIRAVKYVVDCGISVIASSHITDKGTLKSLPFEYFVELKSLNGQPEIYDKNFNSYCGSGADDLDRCVFVGK